MSNDNRPILSLRIDNAMKKELKLISVYEEMTVTDIVIGFIEYGLKKYKEEEILINND